MTIVPSSEYHPLGFFLPTSTKLLMLGSFPPPQHRRSMQFYYPNFQNDMRRILGLIFYHDTTFFIAPNGTSFDETKAKAFCEEKGIGMGDTAKEVIRLQWNASDHTLQVIQTFDIAALLATLPHCDTLAITGQKAMDTLLSQLSFTQPNIWSFAEYHQQGKTFHIYRMPSSSRAYPKPLSEKAHLYKQMFHTVGMI